MNVIVTILIILFGLLPNFFVGSPSGNQAKAQDSIAKNDINILYQKLEEHYNEYGGYPTARDLTEQFDEVLPTLDSEALYDHEDKLINQGSYTYEPTDCTALYCQHYRLHATLNDGSNYTKESLN